MYKARPDVYLWEKIRPLSPMPESYRERYTNVQAALGLAGLTHSTSGRRRPARMRGSWTRRFRGLPGVHVPYVPDDAEHVYYQYCVYAPDRDSLVRRALRRGVDVETLHVDVCSSLPLFGEHPRRPTPKRQRRSCSCRSMRR